MHTCNCESGAHSEPSPGWAGWEDALRCGWCCAGQHESAFTVPRPVTTVLHHRAAHMPPAGKGGRPRSSVDARRAVSSCDRACSMPHRGGSPGRTHSRRSTAALVCAVVFKIGQLTAMPRGGEGRHARRNGAPTDTEHPTRTRIPEVCIDVAALVVQFVLLLAVLVLGKLCKGAGGWPGGARN